MSDDELERQKQNEMLSNRQLWDRAKNIINMSCLKINTVDELNEIYGTKHLYNQFIEASESEKIILRELIDLLMDRNDYINTMDQIMDEITLTNEASLDFCENISKILGEENDEFVLTHSTPKYHSQRIRK